MRYFEYIQELSKNVPPELVDFSQPRDITRTPTQASSNFITNKEQGDWAERLVLEAINKSSKYYVAVKYGKSDDLVAGEDGFGNFFEEFQSELDTIGKRPDLLIFEKGDFEDELGFDISHIPHDQITEYVKKAKAGIEVRSSAFLIDRYDQTMRDRVRLFTKKALKIKNLINENYRHLLELPSRRNYLELLDSLNTDTFSIVDFKVPGWRSSAELVELNNLFKELKKSIKEIQKRDYLSITPKVEDIKVVYKWIETFDVPHYYFQVFFDKVYGISFSQILEIISNSNNDGVIFSVEQDIKNQNKTTIKINSKIGVEIAAKVDEPIHKSVRKETDRGRLLFYVSFGGGAAYLNIDNLKNILGIDGNQF